ncbi:2Fe-2S iron-sulfur cluster binding domain-containing protein [Bdellovibrio sp. HCB2-146]|uniref:2Fe-2S iron-sulfur cluster binding domain-containing protein n=1 Tax=Bdellovibrio sp. HCB2-146 TaxID=3394362 RepID=UPI0039BD69C1
MKVKFIWQGQETEVEAEEGHTFLDIALIAKISPPYSCTEGHCGTCEAILDNGERVRTCQTLPRSDFHIIDYDKAQRN